MSNRGRRGKGPQRILYWFRTPPGVKVGRSPIDEEAIRLVEQHNPDIQFDWSQILRAPSPLPPPTREERRGRDRRGPQRPPPLASRPPHAPAARPASSAGIHGAEPAEELLAEYPEEREELAQGEEHTYEAAAPQTESHEEEGSTESAAGDPGPGPGFADLLEPAERTERSEPAEPPDPAEFGGREELDPRGAAELPVSAAGSRLGPEGLARLRARYAEVMARIAERPLDEAAREQLKLQAERLNPDTWVTADEVGQALEVYESVYEGLRAVVGARQRRRRRGRGRNSGPRAGGNDQPG